MPSPPLSKKEAIISTDTRFGYRDYFHIEAIKKHGKWTIVKSDIDIDDWIDYIKGMKIDHSTDNMTAYCLPNVNFRKWWKSIPEKDRIAF